MAKGNYYDWIVKNWQDIPASVGRRPRNLEALDKWEWIESKNRERIGDYVAELQMIRTEWANLSPADFLEEVMQLKGQDSNFNPTTLEDSLMEYIRQNDHEMDSLAVDDLDDEGNVPDEAIRAKAMAPVDLILSITEEYGDIGNAMAYINRLKKLSDKNQRKDKDGTNNEPAVLVATMHAWKGLECEHLYTQMANGEFLLFTDADILFEKSTLSRAMALVVNEQLDHLSLIFKNIAQGLLLNAMMVDAGGGLFFLFKPWKVSDAKSKHFIGVGALVVDFR